MQHIFSTQCWLPFLIVFWGTLSHLAILASILFNYVGSPPSMQVILGQSILIKGRPEFGFCVCVCAVRPQAQQQTSQLSCTAGQLIPMNLSFYFRRQNSLILMVILIEDITFFTSYNFLAPIYLSIIRPQCSNPLSSLCTHQSCTLNSMFLNQRMLFHVLKGHCSFSHTLFSSQNVFPLLLQLANSFSKPSSDIISSKSLSQVSQALSVVKFSEAQISLDGNSMLVCKSCIDQTLRARGQVVFIYGYRAPGTGLA